MRHSKSGDVRDLRADGVGRRLALAQLPARMRRAIRLFRALTGLSAVTSLRTSFDDDPGTNAIAPPVHPRCASLLRKTTIDAPCAEQRQWHLRTGRRTRAAHSHLCPIGLRCSCVPILYGEKLIGIAKVVADGKTTAHRFSVAADALEMAVSSVCQDLHVSSLTEELDELRRQVGDLRKVCAGKLRDPGDGDRTAEAQAERELRVRDGSLVDRTLAYLARHHLEPGLSLAEVSRALEVNEQYLTRLFTRSVGQHMHAYILNLRVQHACHLLLSEAGPIKAVAYASGFRDPDRFSRVFREHVGVTPSSYRRIFAAS